MRASDGRGGGAGAEWMGFVPVGDDALVATIAITKRLKGRRKRGHSERRTDRLGAGNEKVPQGRLIGARVSANE